MRENNHLSDLFGQNKQKKIDNKLMPSCNEILKNTADELKEISICLKRMLNSEDTSTTITGKTQIDVIPQMLMTFVIPC
jgi:hypothetical protein